MGYLWRPFLYFPTWFPSDTCNFIGKALRVSWEKILKCYGSIRDHPLKQKREATSRQHLIKMSLETSIFLDVLLRLIRFERLWPFPLPLWSFDLWLWYETIPKGLQTVNLPGPSGWTILSLSFKICKWDWVQTPSHSSEPSRSLQNPFEVNYYKI